MKDKIKKMFEEEKKKEIEKQRKNFIKDFGITFLSRSQLNNEIHKSKMRGLCR
ncbi:MAG: hypothetical protein ACRC57_00550 [Sarcina sp.]